MSVCHDTHKNAGPAALAVAVSPDGKLGASVGCDGKIRVADAHSGEEQLAINHATVMWHGCAAFSPDGALLAAGGKNPGVFEAGKKKKVATLKRQGNLEARDIAFSPDSTRVATTSGDIGSKVDPDRSHLRVFAARTGELLLDVELCKDRPNHRAGRCVRWLDDATVVVHDNKVLRFFDAATGGEAAPDLPTYGDPIFDVHEGRIAYPIQDRGEGRRPAYQLAGVDVRDGPEGATRLLELAQRIGGRGPTVTALAFRADGAQIAVGITVHAQDSVPNHSLAIVFDVASGAELLRWELMSDRVHGLAFAPEGDALITADAAGELHRWSTEDGDPTW
jgi:WD40 repeat protein